MSDYKRIFEPGGQYFFTVNIQNRRDDLLIHANPFTHGYVNDLKDWPYSSWHLQEEALKKDIAINHAKWNQMKFGER